MIYGYLHAGSLFRLLKAFRRQTLIGLLLALNLFTYNRKQLGNDLTLILATKNQPSSGPDDARDLNSDGKIDLLDARKLVLLCTRPLCAIK